MQFHNTFLYWPHIELHTERSWLCLSIRQPCGVQEFMLVEYLLIYWIQGKYIACWDSLLHSDKVYSTFSSDNFLSLGTVKVFRYINYLGVHMQLLKHSNRTNTWRTVSYTSNNTNFEKKGILQLHYFAPLMVVNNYIIYTCI